MCIPMVKDPMGKASLAAGRCCGVGHKSSLFTWGQVMSDNRFPKWVISVGIGMMITILGQNTQAADAICGSAKPVDCSVYYRQFERSGPLDPARRIYSNKFHAACASHDYCYRYGHATYQRTRGQCDAEFRRAMMEICHKLDWKAIATGGGSVAECLTTAELFYKAVSTLGGPSFKQGTVQCRYEGYCPPSGEFSTTGEYRGCKCKTGNKVHTGVGNQMAHCAGGPCPAGTFETTGQHKACACQTGSHKEYLDPAKVRATCTVPCPPGRFETTGRYRGCNCPDGKRKDYSGIGNSHAQCQRHDLPCPTGQFETTGKYRGCNCPAGTNKDYSGIGNSHARCKNGHDATCPSGKFDTTGKYRGCKCPPGKKKDYKDIFKKTAKCQ